MLAAGDVLAAQCSHILIVLVLMLVPVLMMPPLQVLLLGPALVVPAALPGRQ